MRGYRASLLCGAAVGIAISSRCDAVVGVDVDFNAGVVDNAVLLNDTVGASTLYNTTTFAPNFGSVSLSLPFNPNYGQGSTVAVVDIGLINNSNPALTRTSEYFNINLPSNTTAPPADLIGDHATDVSLFAAGYNPAPADNFVAAVDFGIAPLANIWSGSIVDSGDPNGVNNQTAASTMYPFVQAMQVGVNGTQADVVNASIGADGVPASDDFFSTAIDGLAAANNHTTVVIAAGNSGPTTGTVGSPAVAFNGITVAALASDPTLTYTTVSSYSSRGPQDFYNPYTNVTLTGVRPAVDIAAPGDYFVSEADPVAGQPGEYSLYIGAGTSFATPMVTGGVAQLTAYAHGMQGLSSFLGLYDPNINTQLSDATDSRVIKAVLMNSADKINGWDNGQTLVNGVITTTQGLDLTIGAGRLNIAQAANNYLNGNFDPKVIGTAYVGPMGWDLSTVTAGVPNIYDLGDLNINQSLDATLDWFADDTYDATNIIASANSFTNLDLEVLLVTGPGQTQLIAESDALYNNVQLLSFTIPAAGDYELEVSYAGVQYAPPGFTANSEQYALAWSSVAVPEPTAGFVMIPLGAMLLRRRRTV